MLRVLTAAAASALIGLSVQACGSSSQSSSPTASSAQSSTATGRSSSTAAGSAPAAGSSSTGAGALSAEARSAATGDIPDNQVFLSYRNAAAGYSVSYPEGWTRQGTGADVTFSDKNNIVHLVLEHARAPSPATVKAELARLEQRNRTLAFSAPNTIRLHGGSAVKATYRTQSPPNPVTGKRVQLIVDRYELAQGGRRATVDLGTPRGVDNVDAYRMMINSFRWR